jgi:hypothetical protein
MTEATTTVNDKIVITEKDYTQFKQDFGYGRFPGRRFGQAFCEHFAVPTHRPQFRPLLESEDMYASVKMIRSLFNFE